MVQEVKQTEDEKISMYMKHCTKLELAKMLVSANLILEMHSKSVKIYNHKI